MMILRQAILGIGMMAGSAAFASCPFGIDCKPPPCEAGPEAPAATGAGGAYAPRFQPRYGTVGSASYQPSNQAGGAYSAHVYGLPPCDPNAKPPETKPVVPVIPVEKPPEEKESDTTEDSTSGEQ
ncbi:hypothetical protein [Thiolapillus sp.]